MFLHISLKWVKYYDLAYQPTSNTKLLRHMNALSSLELGLLFNHSLNCLMPGGDKNLNQAAAFSLFTYVETSVTTRRLKLLQLHVFLFFLFKLNTFLISDILNNLVVYRLPP